MEYIDLVSQHCPISVYQSVVKAGTKSESLDEMLLFSNITSITMTAGCAYGVIGHLSKVVSPQNTDTFKVNYLTLVNKHATNLKGYGDAAAQTLIKDEVGRAIHTIIDDITKSHLKGSILAALSAFRINMLPEIDKRVDYKSLTMKSYMGDWLFNEYATCMGDPAGPERLARLFAKSSAQDLRNILTEMRGKHRRGGYCLSREIIATLVRPYVLDNRKTVDVLGEGPPVSKYARELLDAL